MGFWTEFTKQWHIGAYEQKEEYYNGMEYYKKENSELLQKNAVHITNSKAMANIIDEQEDKIVELEKTNIHSSLTAYNNWAKDNIQPKPQYYNFGTGRKQPHTIFADSLSVKEDRDEIWRFIVKDIDFDPDSYNKVDSLVYGFNVAFSYKYKTSKYYDSDLSLYGVTEYWALAIETIKKLRAGVKAYDCDDSLVLRYACLYMLLDEYYPTEIYRLRGFIVDLWTGGGHAMLGWLRGDNINDFVPIETTFYNDKQSLLWNRKYTIRNQILYKIRYSFDNEHEYVKI